MSNFYAANVPPQPKLQSGWRRGLAKIEKAWEENPMGVAIVAAAVMTAGAKLIDSIGSYQSKRAYAKDAERRSRRL